MDVWQSYLAHSSPILHPVYICSVFCCEYTFVALYALLRVNFSGSNLVCVKKCCCLFVCLGLWSTLNWTSLHYIALTRVHAGQPLRMVKMAGALTPLSLAGWVVQPGTLDQKELPVLTLIRKYVCSKAYLILTVMFIATFNFIIYTFWFMQFSLQYFISHHPVMP